MKINGGEDLDRLCVVLSYPGVFDVHQLHWRHRPKYATYKSTREQGGGIKLPLELEFLLHRLSYSVCPRRVLSVQSKQVNGDLRLGIPLIPESASNATAQLDKHFTSRCKL
jgi:hypothetical protein